jgi:NAD(P)-dependent dehydrogenase (short-subunit alcohol dehydrogenase family)
VTRFDGKVLLATGAGSGIAAAAARRFTADGGRVAVVDVDAQAAAAVAASLDGSIALAADVADEAAVAGAVAEAHERLGRIDCLLNAAGHFEGAPVTEWSLDGWNRMLGVHLGGTFLFCKHVVPIMRSQSGGAIVNTASIAALVSQPVNTAYGAAKGAVLTFSRQLALEAAPEIRVNVLAPGRVRTGMTSPVLLAMGDGDAERGAQLAAEPVVLRRMAEPEELASVACFLLSDDASFVTGSVLVADGGETLV